MGSAGIGVLIALTLGTTCAGYDRHSLYDSKKQGHSFQKDLSFLRNYDFEEPQLFRNSGPMDYKNNKKAPRQTTPYFKGSRNQNRYTKNNNNKRKRQLHQNLKHKYEIIPPKTIMDHRYDRKKTLHTKAYNIIQDSQKKSWRDFGKPQVLPSPEQMDYKNNELVSKYTMAYFKGSGDEKEVTRKIKSYQNNDHNFEILPKEVMNLQPYKLDQEPGKEGSYKIFESMDDYKKYSQMTKSHQNNDHNFEIAPKEIMDQKLRYLYTMPYKIDLGSVEKGGYERSEPIGDYKYNTDQKSGSSVDYKFSNYPIQFSDPYDIDQSFTRGLDSQKESGSQSPKRIVDTKSNAAQSFGPSVDYKFSNNPTQYSSSYNIDQSSTGSLGLQKESAYQSHQQIVDTKTNTAQNSEPSVTSKNSDNPTQYSSSYNIDQTFTGSLDLQKESGYNAAQSSVPSVDYEYNSDPIQYSNSYNMDKASKDSQWFQGPNVVPQKTLADYVKPYEGNQNLQKNYWFPSPKPSVDHTYDVNPEKTSDAVSSHEDNWFKDPEALVKLLEQMNINNSDVISTKLIKQEVEKGKEPEKTKEPKKYKAPEVDLSIEQKFGGKDGWFESFKPTVEHKYDLEPWKTIEHTKPYEISVVKKTGVPEPHLVKIAIPQVIKLKEPHPYAVHISVPVPVAVPIYKLVPKVVEKRIPFEVEKLVPVYKEKPYNVTMEKHYPVYVDKPYPVNVTIYKHVYRKNKHWHSGFVKEYPHPHHYHH